MKVPDDRWASAHDVRLQLQEIADERPLPANRTSPSNKILVATLALFVIIAALGVRQILTPRTPASSATRLQFQLTVPADVRLEGGPPGSQYPVISPDGRH